MQTRLTNQELLKKLEESYLDFTYKESIAPLIPELNEAETKELLGLIVEAEKVQKIVLESKAEYIEQVKALNAEYEKKMDQAVRTITTDARHEAEKMAQTEEGKELEELEKELNEA